MINPCLYQAECLPTFCHIKQTRAALSRLLEKYSLPLSIKNDLLLAVSEYLTNIVKHSQPPAKQLKVKVFNDFQQLTFVINDDGGYFSGLTQQKAQRQTPTYAESGMGLDIIYHLFPGFSYHKNNQWNTFTLAITHHDIAAIKRVALIDDDPIQRQLLTAYLAGSYEVLPYGDGQEFLTHGVQQQFDLVVCDIEMPKLDGLGLKSALQQDQQMSKTPFIFLTGNRDLSTEITANELGIDNYLTKPISKQKLLMSLERTLIRQQQLNDQRQQMISNALCPQIANNDKHYTMTLKNVSPAVGGGDFVVQKTLSDRTIVILADVMGHDETAKLFAHSFDGFIKGLIEQSSAVNLANIFTSLSKQVYQDPLLSKMLLTCIGVELFADHINIVSAGHPSPIIFSGETTQQIDVIGRLPGLCAQTHYQQKTISLASDQQLLLFTDGLFDWANNAADKQQLLSSLLDQCHHHTNSDINNLADAFIDEFSQCCAQPKDDMTFILLQKKHG